MKNSIVSSKKFRYGGSAAALTVIVIALVLLLNVVFTSLAATNSWYTDLTGSSIYSVSDEFVKRMNSLVDPEDGDDVYANIVIMMDEDEFAEHNAYTSYVYRTIKQIEKHCPHIKLVSRNILKDPTLKTRYQLNDYDPILTTDVVIELATEDHSPLSDSNPQYKQSYKKYSVENFFSTATDSTTGSQYYYGYNAEVAFLTAVERLVNFSDRPVAYYLQGHGEPTLASANGWTTILERAGYEAKEINLIMEDFPYEKNSEHNSDMLIINCPISDLVVPTEDDPDSVSEVEKIRSFLQINHGNLFVTEEASTPALYALEELLSEWNLGFGSPVTDSAHSVSGSGAVKILADYDEIDATNTTAKGLLSRITGDTEKSYPSATFSNPKSVVIQNDADGNGVSDFKSAHNTDGMVVGINSGSHAACEILSSYKTAVCDNVQGAVSLAGMAYVEWDRNDTNRTYSCVFCFGSGNFVGDGSINDSIMNLCVSFVNRNEKVTHEGIEIKRFDNESMTSVSTSAANTWTIVCVVVIPLCIVAFGMFVWIRRRHS